MPDLHAPLLDLDPELGQLLGGSRRALALRKVVVRAHDLKEGPWDGERLRGAGPEHVGLLLIDGLVAREVALADNVSCELLGPGDLIRPWSSNDPAQLMEVDVRWTVLDPGRVAVLDRHFTATLAHFPEIAAMLIDRLAERTQRLAVTQSISQLNGVDRRLLALFWHLAERWGRVVPDGVSVSLPLPHRLVAELVGARRPTVSTALGQLAERGLLERSGETWLLRGDPVGLPTGEAARVIRGRRRRFVHEERPEDVHPEAASPPAELPSTGRIGEIHETLAELRAENERFRREFSELREHTGLLLATLERNRLRRRSARS